MILVGVMESQEPDEKAMVEKYPEYIAVLVGYAGKTGGKLGSIKKVTLNLESIYVLFPGKRSFFFRELTY